MFTQKYVDDYVKLPTVSDEFAYLIEWIHEIGFLESSGMGASPISYTTIKAWADLMQNKPTPFDTKTLRDMSSSFIAAQEKSKNIDEPDPLKGLPND